MALRSLDSGRHLDTGLFYCIRWRNYLLGQRLAEEALPEVLVERVRVEQHGDSLREYCPGWQLKNAWVSALQLQP